MAEPSDLPEEFANALAAYERHLVSERDLTPHTVRAYLGDVAGMLTHAAALGCVRLDDLDIRTLRSWLANQQTRGKARTTMARRAKSVSPSGKHSTNMGRGRAGDNISEAGKSCQPRRRVALRTSSRSGAVIQSTVGQSRNTSSVLPK